MSACPSDDQLAHWLGRGPDGPGEEAIAAHVETCAHCQHTLDRLTTPVQTPATSGLHRLRHLLAPDRELSAALAAPDARPWPTIPGYEVLGKLGQGGMGIVYKAQQRQPTRLVALKMILAGDQARPEDIVRFGIEADTIARLAHPNIVQIYDVGTHAGRPYLALEYVGGGSLGDRIAGRPQPPYASAALLEQLALAIHYAHQQGIVHRDLKPANILLAGVRSQGSGVRGQEANASGLLPDSCFLTPDSWLPTPVPKITDFGLARLRHAGPSLTATGVVAGTPPYMAPEQLQGAKGVGPAVDVYALGAILYECLTGRPPFLGAAPPELLRQVAESDPVSPARLAAGVPRDLETICLKCLEKEPIRRYASARDLADDLHRFLAQQPIHARPVGRLERAGKWAHRRPAVAALCAAVLAVTLLGMAGIVWQWQSAVAARNTADEERGRAETERDAARWQLYRASISAAAAELDLFNASACQHHLDLAPPEFRRHWEWRHFRSRLQAPRAHLRGHNGLVYATYFSPDGKRLVSASADGTLRLWDAASFRTLAVLRGHTAEVTAAAFTPDGGRIVSIGGDGARVWNAHSGTAIGTVGKLPQASWIEISPDGRRLFYTTRRGVHFWDVDAGREIATLEDGPPNGRIAYSPDGRFVAANNDQGVRIWDAHTHALVAKIRPPGSEALAIAFSADGKRLATGGDFPEPVLNVFDIPTRTQVFSVKGHTNRIRRLRFSPDGKRLVSTSLDESVRVWDAASGQAIHVLAGHRGASEDADFSRDGRRVVTVARDATVRMWDAASGELLSVLLGRADAFGYPHYSPTTGLITLAVADHSIVIWNAAWLERGDALRGHTGFVYDVAVRADGAQIASAAWDSTVRLWHGTTGQQQQVLTTEAPFLLSVAYSPDGRRVAAGSRDSRLWIWDAASAAVLARRSWPARGLESLAFSPDGQRLVIAFGQTYGGGPVDPTLRILDAADGAEIAVLRGHTDNPLTVRYAPDGRRIASAGLDNTVRIWNAQTARAESILEGHTRWVRSVAWSADGALLASGGDDRTVRLWDAAAGKQIHCLAHASIVYGVAFSPDGQRLAVGCEDNTIRLWDMTTLEEVAELRGHRAYIHAVVFSPDGTRLISGSGDRTVRIWDTHTLQERDDEIRAHER